MAQQNPLNVQCFVKKDPQPVFIGENNPKLLYVSDIRPDASAHPRVMHAHEDFVEIILICSGSSEYLIHDKKYFIQPGDLLVYNAGVVHDEISGPDIEIGSYCVAIGGLHMPGLRPNMLIAQDAGYVFPTGRSFGELRVLFAMMFQNLVADEPRAEAFCNSLMHALLIKVLAVTEGADAEKDKPVEEPPVLGRRIKEYIDKTNRRVTIEYILLDGINDTIKCANELANLLHGLNVYINLIPYNEVKEKPYKRSSKENMRKFYDTLKKRSMNVTLRLEQGFDIDAACGQLRSKHMNK